MIDLTQAFFKQVGLLPEIKEPPPDQFNAYTKEILELLQEMLQLMRLQKEHYIAKTQIGSVFTENDRDAVDCQVKTSIAVCQDKIKDLEELLQKQQSFLVSRNKCEYAHKETAIQCLKVKLGQVTLMFQEFKLYRQRQKEKIAKLTKLSQASQASLSSAKPQQKVVEGHELTQENMILQQKYNQEIEEIMTVQSQIKEISETLQKMGEIIAHQEITTEQLLQCAQDSLDYIEKANKNLVDATKTHESFGSRWGLLFFGMAIFLWFYDYINS